MILFKSAQNLQAHLSAIKVDWHKVGFVPTMGALHAGHLALIGQCRQQQLLTIASIFVNPTQFNDPADFDKYPVTLEKDIELLVKAGCDILFLPSVEEIYPDGNIQQLHYELGALEHVLEGFYRPGHFQGVCQVVHRLLNIVMPGHLYLGRKDYQQCLVIEKMLGQTGLQVAVHLVPTMRETDGLAMSSRNLRLSPAERQAAPAIYQQMERIRLLYGVEPLAELQQNAIHYLQQQGFTKVDYVSIADPVSLQPIDFGAPPAKAVILVAAFLHGVRLIDNLELNEEKRGINGQEE